MNITFAPRGILQIDDAFIIHRNFSGVGSQYNREGDRNFSLVIDDQEIADRLINDGWNVKIRPPREEGEDPFMFLPVKIKINSRGPKMYLKSGIKMTPLDEDTVSILDDVDIIGVDLDIRPYDWEINGKAGRTAYLQNLCVTQRIDRFAERQQKEEEII